MKRLFYILLCLFVLVLAPLTSCKNEVKEKRLPLGKIGELKYNGDYEAYSGTHARSTPFIYLDGVENATVYYLYYNTVNDPSTAKILYTNITNDLTYTFRKTIFPEGNYYLWARASNGYETTDFSNSILFVHDYI